MSAYPFGGHPTFGEYLDWARQQGCMVQCRVHLEGGRSCSMTRIESPDGSRWVVEVGTQQDEFLAPMTVGRFDRRLGLDSPFAKVSSDD